MAKQVIRCLLKSKLHLPSSSLKNQRREYNNKSDGSQPSKPGQPSYRFPHTFFLMRSPANLLASFLRQGQMGAVRGAAGMRCRSAGKDADAAQPPKRAGTGGTSRSGSSRGTSQLPDALTCSCICCGRCCINSRAVWIMKFLLAGSKVCT